MRKQSVRLNKSFHQQGQNETANRLNHSFQDQQQSLKNVSIPQHVMNVADPEVLRKQRIKDINRKYDQLLEKINFMDHHLPQQERKYIYSNETLMPYIYFFKYMAKRPYDNYESEEDKRSRLKLWIPDTIVLNDRDNPGMWFYSSLDGYVYRSDMFVPKNVQVKFSQDAENDYELVAVLKKPQYKNLELVGNDVKSVVVKELPALTANIMSTRGDVTVLQRYVRSKGPKAFICRSVWRRGSNALAWLITNKHDLNDNSIPEADRLMASGSKRFSCTIIQCTGGRFVAETQPYVQNILNWMRNQFKVEFDELACDFIKSRDHNWYFINMRGFSISKCQVPLYIRHITHYGDEPQPQQLQSKRFTKTYSKAKIKPCKYCQIEFPQQDLTHQMTLKMILQTDLHLLHRGKRMPFIEERVNLQHVDIAMLYHKFHVCQSCYTLYLACDGLMNLEFAFAQKLGIEVSEDTRYNIVSISHLDTKTKGRNVIKQPNANKIYGNGENYVMPSDWELQIPTNSEILLQNNQPQIANKPLTKLNQFRMIILFHKLNDIPNKCAESQAKYSLQYNWFQTKIKYNLDMTYVQPHPKGYSIQMNRIKMFHFFAQSRDCLAELFNIIPSLQISLYQDNEKIGTLDCELDDFRSQRVVKRDFFKQFQGKLIYPILSWGLHLSIGVSESGPTDINDIRLYEYNSIFLPESSFYTCEPLPSEWVQLLQQTQHIQRPKSVEQRKPSQSVDASRLFYSTKKSQNLNPFDQLISYTLEDQQEYDIEQFTTEKQVNNLLSQEIKMYEKETKRYEAEDQLFDL